jgi:hypothetical protein
LDIDQKQGFGHGFELAYREAAGLKDEMKCSATTSSFGIIGKCPLGEHAAAISIAAPGVPVWNQDIRRGNFRHRPVIPYILARFMVALIHDVRGWIFST